ncbi:hypothetical protein P7K49_011748 [Saguinus oedipus]|uniref:Ig-like domain-containing protein n=1 Tax=Saguinus oedipus TaxID=9490 RepID=A0ABQ9VRK3_SAGOE|nr:hypothetical protein P7K49_011748 [Saguinus oedipus]
MKDLRRDDADTDWCGIERTGTDLEVKVQVPIDPNRKFSPRMDNYNSKSGTHSCSHPEDRHPLTRKNFSKFSALFSPDHTVPCVPGFLHTLTISENQTQKRLEKETSGVWNSKEGTGELSLCEWAPASDPAATRDFRAASGNTGRAEDLTFQVPLVQALPSEDGEMHLCFLGCLTVSGPSTVTGTVGSSLSVQCRYEEKYKMFNKYWCRQPCLPFWHETVETTGSETVVRSDRVIITDHPGDRTFTVTLENLMAEDAGKYRCGIATILQEDGLSGLLPEPFFQVQVLVSSSI